MMRPIDELMAYYAARQIKTRGVRKPRLSPEAQELRAEFEALMDSLMSLSRLVEHFADRFSEADIMKLYELFPQADFQVMKNNDLMKSPINDLLFEEQVAHFTRMQERERMRKRFRELEKEMLIPSLLIEDLNDAITTHSNMKGSGPKLNIYIQIVIIVVLVLLLFYFVKLFVDFL